MDGWVQLFSVLTFEMLSCGGSSVVVVGGGWCIEVGLINVYSVWFKHIPSSLLF